MPEALPPRMEFTGERIVPGQVEPDLFHEHMARYAFARRLARHKRVLDAACGTGYGSAALAEAADFVAALDISREAVEAAARAYARPNLSFVVARAEQTPFRDASFDLVVAFEVIEHLEDWRALLAEARRLLAPGGQFIVSTPNRLYYAESRAQSGPNPFHVHEFDYAEFRAALAEFFPSAAIYLQNHSGAITFSPMLPGAAAAAELAPGHEPPDPEASHFFLAVCAAQPQTGAPLYVYLPSSGNVLREREEHIRKLEGELRQKDAWLEELKSAHAALQAAHEETLREMEKQVAWAERLDAELEEARATIERQQEEHAAEQRATREAYEGQIRELNSTLETLAAQHREKLEELARCVRLLDEAEARVVERTRWAQQLDARVQQLEQALAMVRASRWVRLGRKLGMGPELE
ncbi:MAG: methyltransferase domain-containing protein [Bryobacteraceae bacterium]|nr:methyltransferase domain-containing protein [Bryobacteraceae bacterium]